MGNVIARNAGAERIINDVSKTLTQAVARGGQIQALAEARLSALYAALAALDQQLNQARTADDVLHAALMARDNDIRQTPFTSPAWPPDVLIRGISDLVVRVPRTSFRFPDFVVFGARTTGGAS